MKKAPLQCGNTGEEPKGGQLVRYHMGTWYYRGKRYATLHQALVDAWQ